jgi:hypothetical protein
MQTTTPTSRAWLPFVLTMLLGVVMAVGIAAAGTPELAWLGFLMAATWREAARGRSRLAGP